MTTSMWAFGRVSPSNGLRLSGHTLRRYSNAPLPAPASGNHTHLKPVDAVTQRELFVNVLNANATKRDAKQYLARFQSPKGRPGKTSNPQEEHDTSNRQDQVRLERIGVNLGGLYAPARAIADTPRFVRENVEEEQDVVQQQTIHVALVYLRTPETLDDSTLDGVALTLSQLVKLDMRIVVVLDDGDMNPNHSPAAIKKTKRLLTQQAERLSKAISRHNPDGARVIDGAIEIQRSCGQEIAGDEDVEVGLSKLVLEPLTRSVMPIIPTLAYTTTGQLVHASASAVMYALTLMLSGAADKSDVSPKHPNGPHRSLDRIILLDTLGGIPSKARRNTAHVFINLDQEFEDVEEELDEYSKSLRKKDPDNGLPNAYQTHKMNLEMVQRCLEALPSASSALIITPEEAASSSKVNLTAEATIGAGTRRQKNTLIHNLLTNKPMVSSSLPVARMPSTASSEGVIVPSQDAPSATLVKRGMPLTIIPAAPRGQGWQAPAIGLTDLNLETDARIDLPRLVHLIEDSFRRKLDLQHYLARIQNRIAGLIIAGAYEGGAILTWEQPPGTSDPSRLVPYLDKFAVLSSSQGSSGVADILFQAMVRTCFPHGVCWRSRKDNPVNKWYFERADGHWQIRGTNWTMFWTGEGVVENRQRWEDYASVCESVGPSWADGKKPD